MTKKPKPRTKKAAPKKATPKKGAVKKAGSQKAAPRRVARLMSDRKRPSKVAKPREAPPSVAKSAVKIAPAKGRPMLTWVGKRPLSQVTAFPAQLVERHDAINILGIGKDNDSYDERMKVFRGLREHWNAKCWEGAPGIAVPESGGLLFHGDNKDVLAHLLASGYRGKVNLIYIDPPFDSGADYIRKVNLRGVRGTAQVDGESYSIGEQIQYTDIWTNDSYLQFMYERFLVLHELLAESGSMWVHCDPMRSHYLKIVLDEVFGPENFVNEIAWLRSAPKGLTGNQFPDNHDCLLYYSKTRELHTWRRQHGEYSAEHLAKFRYLEKGTGRKYMMDNLQNPNPNRPNLTYEWQGHVRCWRWTRERMEEADRAGLIAYAKNGMPYLKRYLDDLKGPTITDIWTDISPINSQAMERANYPTQKPEELLDRVLNTGTNSGDLVLDCFIGSGTTAAVAQKLGRRWIGCDINKGAIQTAAKRLRGTIAEQIAEALAERKDKAAKPPLPGMDKPAQDDKPEPAQFGFTVWRVNDYDLQIQHNEAVNLACEHVGVQRMRTDSYFDGTRGKALVKIVPFGHPLTPLDLEELRRELDARPDEDRAISLVCLGMELAAKAWIEDWNRLRKGKDAVNRIDVIELRTDPKYGKFLLHQPATAKVKIARKEGKIVVEIEDFISPTIVERLQHQAGVVSPKIDDWRAMVDSVMIDTAYNGSVFNVVLADVPAKKTDLVVGKYELVAPAEETAVAVRITDMLGEEVVTISKA